jgi:endonuclease G
MSNIYAFILRFIFLFLSSNTIAQDTLFSCEAYQAYYSFELKAPIYVIYKLYKGGGDCDRDQFSFINSGLGSRTAGNKDYLCSGYDMGHLANAEDFAYDCRLDESTFRFWNCFPQTPELNRGIWKAYENEIRKLSQEDTLTIICGGFYSSKTIGNCVAVPKKCWKIVYKKQQIVSIYIFTNTHKPQKKKISIYKLSKKLRKNDILLNNVKFNKPN